MDESVDVRSMYPTMIPFVGTRYSSATSPRLLLVGEIHYLPAASTQHLDPDKWYGGSAARLNEEEIHWISTTRIVREACDSGFRFRAHGIWRNAFRAVNEAGPKYEHFAEVAEDIAFYNFFQRPAVEGLSIEATDRDITIANAVFGRVMNELKPKGVAFVSRRAWFALSPQTAGAVPMIGTAHPSTIHWHRKADAYGGRSGKQVLMDFVREHVCAV